MLRERIGFWGYLSVSITTKTHRSQEDEDV